MILIFSLFWLQGNKVFGRVGFVLAPFLNNHHHYGYILNHDDSNFFSKHNLFINFNNSAQKTNPAGSATLRFFIITIGAFPLAYLISYPIIIASTRQNDWSQNKQILTAMAVSGGISLSISLIDLFIGMGKKESRGYSAI